MFTTAPVKKMPHGGFEPFWAEVHFWSCSKQSLGASVHLQTACTSEPVLLKTLGLLVQLNSYCRATGKPRAAHEWREQGQTFGPVLYRSSVSARADGIVGKCDNPTGKLCLGSQK